MSHFSKNQLQRYPIYLKFLKELAATGATTVPSPLVSKELGYSEEQVRKDFQAVSAEPGRPKKGRDLIKLIETLETFLGYRGDERAVVIGAGNLGEALLKYPHFKEMGFSIVAAFDIDSQKVGTDILGKPVYHLSMLREKLPSLGARIAILTVPASAAQETADLAVRSGAKGLWNFAPTHINAPKGVVVETVNLSSSLAVLSHRLNQVCLKEEKK